jgi:hypothetical protein
MIIEKTKFTKFSIKQAFLAYMDIFYTSDSIFIFVFNYIRGKTKSTLLMPCKVVNNQKRQFQLKLALLII